MRSYGATIQPYLLSRAPIVSRILVYITARDRSDNSPYSIGFWNGPDHQDFDIGGDIRTYYAAGDFLTVEPLDYAAGLTVRSWNITLSGLSPEVLTAVRQYDAKHAPVEAHQVFYDPNTELMLDSPVRIFKGQISELPMDDGSIGGVSSVKLELVNDTINLTRTCKLKKSDESYKRRSGDRIFKYADISGSVQVVWGQQPPRTAPTSTPPSTLTNPTGLISGIFG